MRRTALGLALLTTTSCHPAAPRSPETPETLFTAARVWGHPEADALLVTGDRIAAVGRAAGLRAQAPLAREVDARGGWLLPGFHDAHVHVLSGGEALAQPDLSACEDVACVVTAVQTAARAQPDAPWVMGRGWRYDVLAQDPSAPRRLLDAVVPDRPVMLEAYDGHAVWLNSRALALAGIDAVTPDPAHGRVVRDAEGPSGVLLERAADLVKPALPPRDRDADLLALRRALDHLVPLGITAVQDIAEDPERLQRYRDLEAAGELPVRVFVALPLIGPIEAYARLPRASPRVALSFLKVFVDGVIESRTAFLLEPYAGSSERGQPTLGPDALLAQVMAARAHGFGVAMHAIGDAAVRQALDVYEEAAQRLGPTPLAMRIEHLEIVDPGDLGRLAPLGVIASMQPSHATPGGDSPNEGVWSENLGLERLPQTFPWRALRDHGARLAFGSDWPVMSADPLEGLAVALTRQDREGRPAGGWNAHQRLSAEEAIAAYTEGAAATVGRADTLGRLAPGFLADLVLLSPEVDFARPATLWAREGQRRVQGVWSGGEPVWPR